MSSSEPEPDETTEEKTAPEFSDRAKDAARHVWMLLRHWISGGHQSAEEIRRRLVLRQLLAYEGLRERAREELDEVRTRIIKLESRGAADGWSPEERAEVKELRADRKRRETSYRDLAKEPFRPVQPDPQQIRRARYGGSVRRAAALTALCGALTYVAARAPTLGLLLLLAAAGAVLWVGRHAPTLTTRPVPSDLLERPELAPDAGLAELDQAADDVDQADADIRGVTAPDEATACIRRALTREGIKLREVHGATRTSWGWRAVAVLADGTSADVVRALRDLERALRVGEGRVMAAGSKTDGALVTISVLTSDPFASPPPYPVRAPHSESILTPVSLTISIDGEAAPIRFAGRHVLVVASSGGGKSALVRALADFVTSCRDAVAWDIDPTGVGLGPLRGVAGHIARTPKEAEKAIEKLYSYAMRRTTLLGDGEDDNWQVTPDAPAIIGFVDEFPLLTKKGKKLAIDLLKMGRKTRITLVICTQDATSDVMSDAVADAVAIRIMLPCRLADVPLAVGSHTAVSEGWLPHRLEPGDEDDPADAGKCYMRTPQHREPILRYVIPLDRDTALLRAKERVAAGLVQIDARTTGAESTPAVPHIADLMFKAFEEAKSGVLPVAALLDVLADDDHDRWTQWDSRKDRLAMAGREISAELRAAGLDVSSERLNGLPGRPTGYRLDTLKAALQPAD